MRTELKTKKSYKGTVGDYSEVTCGDSSEVIAGFGSVINAGDKSILTARIWAVLKAGERSVLKSGSMSRLTGGAGSVLSAGYRSTLTWKIYDHSTQQYKLYTFCVGENGVKRNVAYVFDENTKTITEFKGL